MKHMLIFFMMLSVSTYADSIYATQLFKTWPGFSLQHEFADQKEDLIAFRETDFITLRQQAEQKNDPMVPVTKKRVFDDLLSLKNPNVRYTIFMTATAGNRVSGFSQGVAMSTML
ncbi:MAG: hypothetical protein NE327_20560, partial [Lentisphaeraceae bacterium]|nr:hypothetical protein [Lentisphaeraceae bacterium]